MLQPMNEDKPIRPVEASIRGLLGEARDFARREPATAVAAAFGLGLIINLLPSRVLAGAAAAVGATLLRPAMISLGVIKAIELCCTKAPQKINS